MPSMSWAAVARDEALPTRPVEVRDRGGDRVDDKFFGLDVVITENGMDSWPALVPSSVRVVAPWPDVEKRRGIYDWSLTDLRFETAQRHGARPLFTILGTPSFYALRPSSGNASPPRLGAYKRFVEALVNRYGARADYQVWNEPSVPMFYDGPVRHMARMTAVFAAAAHKAAPKATVVAPSFPLRVASNRRWFRQYWGTRVGNTRVGSVVDVASISAYPLPDGDPEEGLAITSWARRVVSNSGFSGPLWATEINYGGNSGYPTKEIPMRRQVSYVVRTFVLHATHGADRIYWWSWSPDITVNTELQNEHGGLTRAGTAFGVVRDWLVGTRPKGCATEKGVTTCGFRVNGSTLRRVSWSRDGRKRTILAPRGAWLAVRPTGEGSAIEAGNRLRVGVTPVMVEVRRG